MLTGLLLLNKPLGMRSTMSVEIVRRIIGRKNKVGHGGTLDSTASGLLVLLVGAATRLSDLVMDMPKCYEATVCLGTETSTDDASGEVLFAGDAVGIGEAEIDTLLPSFFGWRMQAPPAISAVHVDGRRAHELARDGVDLRLKERPVYFESVARTGAISGEGTVTFRIRCGKGTYVRSFARDLGRVLGCGAHLSSLRRLLCGPFCLENSLDGGVLKEMSADDIAEKLLPIESVSTATHFYTASDEDSQRLSNGLDIRISGLARQNFAMRASAPGNITVKSKNLFSVCRFKEPETSGDLIPTVNLRIDGGDRE